MVRSLVLQRVKKAGTLDGTYLLAEQGAPILELVNLEALSADAVYEFAFIGGSLKLRGADAAPIRPIAIPLRN